MLLEGLEENKEKGSKHINKFEMQNVTLGEKEYIEIVGKLQKLCQYLNIIFQTNYLINKTEKLLYEVTENYLTTSLTKI